MKKCPHMNAICAYKIILADDVYCDYCDGDHCAQYDSTSNPLKIKKRDMKLKDYNVSKTKYLELKYFCMQYAEKKKELQKGYGLNAIASDGMPKGNMISNPTEAKAIRNIALRKDIELIEQTAIEADPEIYDYILKNVTEGIAYEYLGSVPKARKQFYESRRMFFYLLAQKR